MRTQLTLGDEQKVAEHGGEAFPAAYVERLQEGLFREERVAGQTGLAAAVVDGALLRDKQGALLAEGPERLRAGDRSIPAGRISRQQAVVLADAEAAARLRDQLSAR